MTGRERILAQLVGGEADSLPLMPITMMFAADRIGVPYGRYAADHRVLVEAQLRTAEEFDFDHVSAISDPAREAADCGAKIVYPENQPPAIVENEALLSDKTVLKRLERPDPLGGGRMHDRVRAIEVLCDKLRGEKMVEGWIEGPCAEAADLRGINHLMMDFFDDPAFVTDLFDVVLEMELSFARAQVAAGAELIGVGDAAASLVGPRIYEEFVWPYEKKMVDGLHELGARVRLHICGDTRKILEPMGRLGCEIVDLDYPVPLSEARAAMGPAQVLLGNLDPVRAVCQGTPDSITEGLRRCHAEAGAAYITGAGCEIVRDTPLENLKALTTYARTHRPQDC